MIQPFPMTWGDTTGPAAGAAASWHLPLALRLEAWLGFTECNSAFGPLLFLQTSLLLSSLRARITFREREGGGRDHTHEVPLVQAAQRITPPSQMVRASFPHPDLAMKVRDQDGEPLTDEAAIGACVNGWREADAVFTGVADVSLRLSGRADSDGASAPVALQGELVLARGCALHLDFRSLRSGRDPGHVSGTDVVVAPAGQCVTFPDRTIRDSWPRFSWLSVGLIDDYGLPLGEERFLGRLLPG